MSAAIGPQLSAVVDGLNKNAPPPIKENIHQTRADASAGFDKKNAPQVGSTLPSFSLQNAGGQTVTLDALLSKPDTKGALITFYRGNWCPFCNIEISGLQKRLDDFTAAGVTLVAISSETPDQTLSTKEKNELKFEVLSDPGTAYAAELGLKWDVPDDHSAVLKEFGTDLTKHNGSEKHSLPIASNILVDKDRKVVNIYVEPDWMQRLEPQTAVEWAQAL